MTVTPAQKVVKWTPVVQGLDPSQIVMCVDRQTKDGGSHFLLTFPEPIFVLNFDLGLKEAASKPQFAGKEIYEKRFLVDDLTYGNYEELLDEAWLYMRSACKEADEAGGTVGIDQSTLLWQVIYTVYCGKVQSKDHDSKAPTDMVAMEKMLPFFYADANTRMEQFLHRPLAYDHCSAVYIDRVKPLRGSDGKVIKPEVYERQGYGHMDTSMPMTMRLEYHQADPKKPDDEEYREGIISACRLMPSLRGKRIGDPSYETVREFLAKAVRDAK